MDPIKEAFLKIKDEISLLKKEIKDLNQKVDSIEKSTQNQPEITNPTHKPTHIQTIPTQNQPEITIPTHNPTHIQTIPTHNNAIESLYNQNKPISIGNDGVPTHKPTNQQTNKPTLNEIDSDFKKANNILESLDNVKKGIRLKFKRLTPQEMLVFSTLYTLEEQNYEEITYRIISTKLKLSESSIRDYINKLINKGIPIEKGRQNNKTIILKISKDLKNIANLTTIQNLRSI